MKKIAVSVHFMTEERKEKIRRAAEKGGYEVEFYDNDDAAVGKISDAEIVFCETPKPVKGLSNIRWCASSYAGIAPYLETGVLPEGCQLTNGAGSYGVTISEHIVMMALMLLKQMPRYGEIIANREWRHDVEIRSIYGSRVTILGTGDIGKYTAKRMKGMAAKSVIGMNRSGQCDEPAFDRIITREALDSVLTETDILVLAMPETKETRGTLSKERIALLPEHAIVINVGRGSAIDQEALMEALNSGRIAGAALDVVMPEPLPKDHPLWETRNTIITPHISGNMSLEHTREESVDLFCANVERYI
ncbi:MAG: D-2-hydroxyacid dehydrogenase, partial [Eubacteriales bacterium]|nr:D-2-hydroxyacid dehydrogenase [Eubacteriales bacterium]